MNQVKTKQTERLADVRKQGIDALKGLSKRLNNEQSILDCTDVVGLEKEEIEALFHYIRIEWRRRIGLHNFIKINTFDDDGNLRGIISEYTDNGSISEPSSDREKSEDIPVNPPENNKKNLFPLVTVAGLIVLAGLILLYKHSSAISPNKPVTAIEKSSSTIPVLEANKLTIGVLGQSDRYTELESYLHNIFGDRILIKLDDSSKIDNRITKDKLVRRKIDDRIAKDKIARQEWDIVFTLSPMISIAAKDNGYTWAARMFPDTSFYQSAFFVKADSQIQSLEDLTPKTVIALGGFNSASSFYMPSYTLYGKRLIVERGHSPKEIKEMVKSDRADVGTAAYPAAINEQKSEFRIIHKSRDIPGAGVYLSPKLSVNDRELIKIFLLKAPEVVRDDKHANYGVGKEPDYSQFREITNKVALILNCTNWEQKSIQFYCPEKDTGIAGKIISALPSLTDSNQAHLELRISDRQTYQVLLPLALINQIPGGGSLLNLKNKQVRLIDVTPSKGSDGKLKIKIDRASQIKIQQ